MFEKFDTDKDGFLSYEEFKVFWKLVNEELKNPFFNNEIDLANYYKQWDTNEDGKISQTEFNGMFKDIWQRSVS
jgi:Ca2+-binding EF-hand superfamily protein